MSREASTGPQGVATTVTQADIIVSILALEKLSALRVDFIPALRVEFKRLAKSARKHRVLLSKLAWASVSRRRETQGRVYDRILPMKKKIGTDRKIDPE